MSAMDDYLGRVQGLVVSLTGTLEAQPLAEVRHLIDHGEPAEGLRALAWVIVEDDMRVAASVIESIRQLTHGLVPESDLPADLSDHALS